MKRRGTWINCTLTIKTQFKLKYLKVTLENEYFGAAWWGHDPTTPRPQGGVETRWHPPDNNVSCRKRDTHPACRWRYYEVLGSLTKSSFSHPRFGRDIVTVTGDLCGLQSFSWTFIPQSCDTKHTLVSTHVWLLLCVFYPIIQQKHIRRQQLDG